MYEGFKVRLILQTSANTWDPSEEHECKWNPALSLSCQFTVTRRSWLPLGCLVLTGKCGGVTLWWNEAMRGAWKIVLFLLLLVWPVKTSVFFLFKFFLFCLRSQTGSFGTELGDAETNCSESHWTGRRGDHLKRTSWLGEKVTSSALVMLLNVGQ